MLKVDIQDGNPHGYIQAEGTGEQIVLDLISVITAIYENYKIKNLGHAHAFRAILMTALSNHATWEAGANIDDSKNERLGVDRD